MRSNWAVNGDDSEMVTRMSSLVRYKYKNSTILQYPISVSHLIRT